MADAAAEVAIINLTRPDGEAERLAAAVLPSHYSQFNIEPIRFGVENYGRGVLVTKIVKYIMRAPFKGNREQDYLKAARCLQMLTLFDRGDPDWWKHREVPHV